MLPIIIVIFIKLKTCEETKNTDNTSDAESGQNESESMPIEPQAGMLLHIIILLLNKLLHFY